MSILLRISCLTQPCTDNTPLSILTYTHIPCDLRHQRVCQLSCSSSEYAVFRTPPLCAKQAATKAPHTNRHTVYIP